MKKTRSYGEDPEDDASGEKGGVFKDWPRRDPDSDRDTAFRRRFYHKSSVDGVRKGSGSSSVSSYDHRLVDDERELPSRPRKRFEYEPDGIDRRKGGGLDRYWDSGPERKKVKIPNSPRLGYGGSSGDRISRSESFSVSRREFPKKFRSERDRSRRDGSSVGSSWRRSSSMKEVADEEVRSRGLKRVDGGRLGSEDRSKSSWSRDSSSGEPTRSIEVKKPTRSIEVKKPTRSIEVKKPTRSIEVKKPTRSVEVKKPARSEFKKVTDARKICGGSCGFSEKEEGELEPEPEPVAKMDPSLAIVVEDEPLGGMEDSTGGDEAPNTVVVAKSSGVRRFRLEEDCADSCSKDSDLASEMLRKSPDESHNNHGNFDGLDTKDREDDENGLDTKDREEDQDGLEMMDTEEADAIAIKAKLPTGGVENETEIAAEMQPRLELPSNEHEGLEKEHLVEEESESPDATRDAGIASPLSDVKVEKDEVKSITRHVESEAFHSKEVEKNEESSAKLVVKKKIQSIVDLMVEPVNANCRPMDTCGEVAKENSTAEVTLQLLTEKTTEKCRDKGKSLAISLSNEAHSADDDDEMEGPSCRGLDLFSSESMRRDKVNPGGIIIGKQKDEKLKLEPLDLSLGLPGTSLDHPFRGSEPMRNSPGRARSMQSLPSSFRTNSDGFTASISMSGSQTFVHNPSCSLTHNSMDNYEHSVGSRPIFQVIDQVSDGTVWRGQSSSDLKNNGVLVPFQQRMLQNNLSNQSSFGHLYSSSSNLQNQSSIPRHISHTQGFYQTSSQNSKEKVLTRERSSSGLLKHSQQVVEVSYGTGTIEKILNSIVSEPLQAIGSTIQGMTEHSVSYLKEVIEEMFGNKDKNEELIRLRETLSRRSDMTLETLSSSQRILLEILVSVKTGLPDFLRRADHISSSDLAEIFLNLRCRNLACRASLPVDDCDCKVCSQKTGFCSTCMCLVCSKFDMASNTCSWVGCDTCLHWCHTDCALQNCYIKNGRSVTGVQGTEMQFFCVACGLPSEMFGFVKDVFSACAKEWKAETLAKELECVRKIFASSEDVRCKRLSEVAAHLSVKLENKSNISEVCHHIMGFLAESDSNTNTSPPIFAAKEVSINNKDWSNGTMGNAVIVGTARATGSSSEAIGTLSATQKFPTTDVPPSIDHMQLGKQCVVNKIQQPLQKKPAEDELESIIKFKLAEAKMYQKHADDARREAEGLKRIAIAKNDKIDAEYAARVDKLHLLEAEEKRRQKLEEFQAFDRLQRDYLNMKIRMETDIKDLMLKMEATKRNINA